MSEQYEQLQFDVRPEVEQLRDQALLSFNALARIVGIEEAATELGYALANEVLDDRISEEQAYDIGISAIMGYIHGTPETS